MEISYSSISQLTNKFKNFIGERHNPEKTLSRSN